MSVLLDALRKAAAEKQAAGNDSPKTARPGGNSGKVGDSHLRAQTTTSGRPESSQADQTAGSELERRDRASTEASPLKTGELDWSLSQIPGYQPRSVPEAAERNRAQEVLQAMQPVQKTARYSFRWLGLGALAMFVLAGIGYYGWAYFQMQTQAVAYELAAYQTVQPVASTAPKPESAVPTQKSKPAETTRATSVSTVPVSVGEGSIPKRSQAASKQVSQPASEKKPTAPSAPSSLSKEHLKIVAVTEPTDAEKGYQAYQAGHLNQARRFYNLAYQQNGENIAALFGLAAIAVKQGQKLDALQYYQRILEIDPQNQRAKDAELMLGSQIKDGAKTTGTLAKRARDFPDNAALQAALGHQLAKKNDWVGAQKQYFKAYQLAPDRGDYALNLAVSLDTLGEYALAKQYYERVLQGPTTGLSLKRKEQVRQRVAALQAFLNRETKS
ncbi:hypothetical protein AVO42_05220 [Thiomicrospira sp. XS5]|uniref:tetratricopeptide repeat protein n=1 Tax=Thiomicrospira sp. XS5 TaxID=1775636 RepID=UPI0007468FC9|nr:tetratricopeptide repeat protein [Thiomicrospira sp. XS5]KUJ74790.1 hypothetical protein AVO42_05220 [Thiomicrospira sp. XS5]